MEIYTFWVVIFTLATVVISALLHYHFVSSSYRLIPVATHLLLIFSIFTCIMPFPLLVLDVDAALSAPDGAPASAFDETARSLWLFLFLASQVMAWLALPIAQSYDTSGQFTVADRLKASVRENVKMYLILGVAVGALLGYIMFLKGASSFADVFHVTIAAANAFGLFLLVVFLACGLLGVPRRLWRMADPEALLEEEYRRARTLHDELDVARTDVVLLRIEATTRHQQLAAAPATNATAAGAAAGGAEERAHLAQVIASIELFATEVPLQQHGAERPDDRKHQSLVELHEDIMSAIKVCRRLNFQWHECVRACIDYSNVVAGTTNSLYWRVIRKPLMRVGCAVAIILTALVLFSELVVPFQTIDASRQISIVEILLQNSSMRFVSSISVLFYMGACGYWAIFQFHVFDLFVVVPRISDAASLCFVVTFLTRLVLPLCYNFLWIADLTNNSHKHVTYSGIFGKMDVVDFLGKWFNRFMPVFIPVLAVLIEAKVIHRFLQWVGVEGFETGEESDAARRQAVEEGRAIVARESNMEMRAVHTHVPHSPATNVAIIAAGGGAANVPGAANAAAAAAAAASSASSSAASSKTVEERQRRYAAWKAAHGGGSASDATGAADVV